MKLRKLLDYEHRVINVEKRTFNSLVFASTVGTESSTSKGITRLAAEINEKSIASYSDAIRYV